jgi:hypothetical protein
MQRTRGSPTAVANFAILSVCHPVITKKFGSDDAECRFQNLLRITNPVSDLTGDLGPVVLCDFSML